MTPLRAVLMSPPLRPPLRGVADQRALQGGGVGGQRAHLLSGEADGQRAHLRGRVGGQW